MAEFVSGRRNSEFSLHCRPAAPTALSSNPSLLQTPFWAEFKQAFGWQSFPFIAEIGSNSFSLLGLYRQFTRGLGLVYLPYPNLPQPESAEKQADLLLTLGRALSPLLPAGSILIRYDLLWQQEHSPDPAAPPLTISGRLKKAPMDIQPPSTVVLNLQQPEELLLQQMKQKCRYNINLAARKGVVVQESASPESGDLAEWYRLYKETAQRDKIVLHSYAYYQQLFACAGNAQTGSPLIKLLTARINQELAAGIILAIHGQQATYLYGASGNLQRNYMPNHALQWAAIKLAKAAGCTSYDFFGIPAADNPADPMHGLYRFKTGFGGQIVHRYGCYDFINSPLLYSCYRMAEGVRKFYFKKFRRLG